MNKARSHDLQIKILITATPAVVVTLYHWPQSAMERW